MSRIRKNLLIEASFIYLFFDSSIYLSIHLVYTFINLHSKIVEWVPTMCWGFRKDCDKRTFSYLDEVLTGEKETK